MPILDPSKRDVPVLGLIQAVQPGLYSEIVNQQQSGLLPQASDGVVQEDPLSGLTPYERYKLEQEQKNKTDEVLSKFGIRPVAPQEGDDSLVYFRDGSYVKKSDYISAITPQERSPFDEPSLFEKSVNAIGNIGSSVLGPVGSAIGAAGDAWHSLQTALIPDSAMQAASDYAKENKEYIARFSDVIDPDNPVHRIGYSAVRSLLSLGLGVAKIFIPREIIDPISEGILEVRDRAIKRDEKIADAFKGGALDREVVYGAIDSLADMVTSAAVVLATRGGGAETTVQSMSNLGKILGFVKNRVSPFAEFMSAMSPSVFEQSRYELLKQPGVTEEAARKGAADQLAAEWGVAALFSLFAPGVEPDVLPSVAKKVLPFVARGDKQGAVGVLEDFFGNLYKENPFSYAFAKRLLQVNLEEIPEEVITSIIQEKQSRKASGKSDELSGKEIKDISLETIAATVIASSLFALPGAGRAGMESRREDIRRKGYADFLDRVVSLDEMLGSLKNYFRGGGVQEMLGDIKASGATAGQAQALPVTAPGASLQAQVPAGAQGAPGSQAAQPVPTPTQGFTGINESIPIGPESAQTGTVGLIASREGVLGRTQNLEKTRVLQSAIANLQSMASRTSNPEEKNKILQYLDMLYEAERTGGIDEAVRLAASILSPEGVFYQNTERDARGVAPFTGIIALKTSDEGKIRVSAPIHEAVHLVAKNYMTDEEYERAKSVFGETQDGRLNEEAFVHGFLDYLAEKYGTEKYGNIADKLYARYSQKLSAYLDKNISSAIKTFEEIENGRVFTRNVNDAATLVKRLGGNSQGIAKLINIAESIGRGPAVDVIAKSLNLVDANKELSESLTSGEKGGKPTFKVARKAREFLSDTLKALDDKPGAKLIASVATMERVNGRDISSYPEWAQTVANVIGDIVDKFRENPKIRYRSAVPPNAEQTIADTVYFDAGGKDVWTKKQAERIAKNQPISITRAESLDLQNLRDEYTNRALNAVKSMYPEQFPSQETEEEAAPQADEEAYVLQQPEEEEAPREEEFQAPVAETEQEPINAQPSSEEEIKPKKAKSERKKKSQLKQEKEPEINESAALEDVVQGEEQKEAVEEEEEEAQELESLVSNKKPSSQTSKVYKAAKAAIDEVAKETTAPSEEPKRKPEKRQKSVKQEKEPKPQGPLARAMEEDEDLKASIEEVTNIIRGKEKKNVYTHTFLKNRLTDIFRIEGEQNPDQVAAQWINAIKKEAKKSVLSAVDSVLKSASTDVNKGNKFLKSLYDLAFNEEELNQKVNEILAKTEEKLIEEVGEEFQNTKLGRHIDSVIKEISDIYGDEYYKDPLHAAISLVYAMGITEDIPKSTRIQFIPKGEKTIYITENIGERAKSLKDTIGNFARFCRICLDSARLAGSEKYYSDVLGALWKIINGAYVLAGEKNRKTVEFKDASFALTVVRTLMSRLANGLEKPALKVSHLSVTTVPIGISGKVEPSEESDSGDMSFSTVFGDASMSGDTISVNVSGDIIKRIAKDLLKRSSEDVARDIGSVYKEVGEGIANASVIEANTRNSGLAFYHTVQHRVHLSNEAILNPDNRDYFLSLFLKLREYGAETVRHAEEFARKHEAYAEDLNEIVENILKNKTYSLMSYGEKIKAENDTSSESAVALRDELLAFLDSKKIQVTKMLGKAIDIAISHVEKVVEDRLFSGERGKRNGLDFTKPHIRVSNLWSGIATETDRVEDRLVDGVWAEAIYNPEKGKYELLRRMSPEQSIVLSAISRGVTASVFADAIVSRIQPSFSGKKDDISSLEREIVRRALLRKEDLAASYAKKRVAQFIADQIKEDGVEFLEELKESISRALNLYGYQELGKNNKADFVDQIIGTMRGISLYLTGKLPYGIALLDNKKHGKVMQKIMDAALKNYGAITFSQAAQIVEETGFEFSDIAALLVDSGGLELKGKNYKKAFDKFIKSAEGNRESIIRGVRSITAEIFRYMSGMQIGQIGDIVSYGKSQPTATAVVMALSRLNPTAKLDFSEPIFFLNDVVKDAIYLSGLASPEAPSAELLANIGVQDAMNPSISGEAVQQDFKNTVKERRKLSKKELKAIGKSNPEIADLSFRLIFEREDIKKKPVKESKPRLGYYTIDEITPRITGAETATKSFEQTLVGMVQVEDIPPGVEAEEVKDSSGKVVGKYPKEYKGIARVLHNLMTGNVPRAVENILPKQWVMGVVTNGLFGLPSTRYRVHSLLANISLEFLAMAELAHKAGVPVEALEDFSNKQGWTVPGEMNVFSYFRAFFNMPEAYSKKLFDYVKSMDWKNEYVFSSRSVIGMALKRAADFMDKMDKFESLSKKEQIELGKAFMFGNRKSNQSVNHLLATCLPSTACRNCYAGAGIIRDTMFAKTLAITLLQMYNPEVFGKAIAAYVRSVPKYEMPFIRWNGSGDSLYWFQVKAFNSYVANGDRPVHVFSRSPIKRVDGTASLMDLSSGRIAYKDNGEVDLENSVFVYKEGSLDEGLFEFYVNQTGSVNGAIELLRSMFLEHGIISSYLYTGTEQDSIILKLLRDNHIPVVVHPAKTTEVDRVTLNSLLRFSVESYGKDPYFDCACAADAVSNQNNCPGCFNSPASACFLSRKALALGEDGRVYFMGKFDKHGRLLDPTDFDIQSEIQNKRYPAALVGIDLNTFGTPGALIALSKKLSIISKTLEDKAKSGVSKDYDFYSAFDKKYKISYPDAARLNDAAKSLRDIANSYRIVGLYLIDKREKIKKGVESGKLTPEKVKKENIKLRAKEIEESSFFNAFFDQTESGKRIVRNSFMDSVFSALVADAMTEIKDHVNALYGEAENERAIQENIRKFLNELGSVYLHYTNILNKNQKIWLRAVRERQYPDIAPRPVEAFSLSAVKALMKKSKSDIDIALMKAAIKALRQEYGNLKSVSRLLDRLEKKAETVEKSGIHPQITTLQDLMNDPQFSRYFADLSFDSIAKSYQDAARAYNNLKRQQGFSVNESSPIRTEENLARRISHLDPDTAWEVREAFKAIQSAGGNLSRLLRIAGEVLMDFAEGTNKFKPFMSTLAYPTGGFMAKTRPSVQGARRVSTYLRMLGQGFLSTRASNVNQMYAVAIPPDVGGRFTPFSPGGGVGISPYLNLYSMADVLAHEATHAVAFRNIQRELLDSGNIQNNAYWAIFTHAVNRFKSYVRNNRDRMNNFYAISDPHELLSEVMGDSYTRFLLSEGGHIGMAVIQKLIDQLPYQWAHYLSYGDFEARTLSGGNMFPVSAPYDSITKTVEAYLTKIAGELREDIPVKISWEIKDVSGDNSSFGKRAKDILSYVEHEAGQKEKLVDKIKEYAKKARVMETEKAMDPAAWVLRREGLNPDDTRVLTVKIRGEKEKSKTASIGLWRGEDEVTHALRVWFGGEVAEKIMDQVRAGNTESQGEIDGKLKSFSTDFASAYNLTPDMEEEIYKNPEQARKDFMKAKEVFFDPYTAFSFVQGDFSLVVSDVLGNFDGDINEALFASMASGNVTAAQDYVKLGELAGKEVYGDMSAYTLFKPVVARGKYAYKVVSEHVASMFTPREEEYERKPPILAPANEEDYEIGKNLYDYASVIVNTGNENRMNMSAARQEAERMTARRIEKRLLEAIENPNPATLTPMSAAETFAAMGLITSVGMNMMRTGKEPEDAHRFAKLLSGWVSLGTAASASMNARRMPWFVGVKELETFGAPESLFARGLQTYATSSRRVSELVKEINNLKAQLAAKNATEVQLAELKTQKEHIEKLHQNYIKRKRKEIEEYKRERNLSKEEVEELKKTLAATEEENRAMIENFNAKIKALEEELKKKEAQRRGYKGEATRLRGKLEELQGRLQESYGEVERITRALRDKQQQLNEEILSRITEFSDVLEREGIIKKRELKKYLEFRERVTRRIYQALEEADQSTEETERVSLETITTVVNEALNSSSAQNRNEDGQFDVGETSLVGTDPAYMIGDLGEFSFDIEEAENEIKKYVWNKYVTVFADHLRRIEEIIDRVYRDERIRGASEKRAAIAYLGARLNFENPVLRQISIAFAKAFAFASAQAGSETFADKAHRWYITSIMASPKMLFRNAIGNTTMLGLDLFVHRPVATLVSYLSEKLFGGTHVYRASDYLEFLKEVPLAAQMAAQAFLETWKHGIPVYSMIARNIGPERATKEAAFTKILAAKAKSNTIFGKPVAALANFSKAFVRLAVATDEAFKAFEHVAYFGLMSGAITRKLAAAGVDMQAINSFDVLDEVNDLAWKRAQLMTFTSDLPDAAQAFSDFIERMPGLRYVVPFRKTPLNILMFGMSKTLPFAAVKALKTAVDKTSSPEDKIESIAWLAISTAITGLAAALLIGDDDDDEEVLPRFTGTVPVKAISREEAELRRIVAPSASIRLGSVYVSYRELDPFSTIFTNSIDLVRSFKKAVKSGNVPGITQASAEYLQQALEGALDRSYFESLYNAYENLFDPDKRMTFFGGIASGFVPTFVRNLASDPDEFVRAMAGKGVDSALMRRVFPPALPVRRYLTGSEIRKVSPTNIWPIDSFIRLFNPFYVTTIPSALEGKLYRKVYGYIEKNKNSESFISPNFVLPPAPYGRYKGVDYELTADGYTLLLDSYKEYMQRRAGSVVRWLDLPDEKFVRNMNSLKIKALNYAKRDKRLQAYMSGQ